MSPETEKAAPVQFQFQNLFITKAVFELLASDVRVGVIGAERVTVQLEVKASAEIKKDASKALVRLETKIIPDQTFQPYRLEVNIVAVYGAQGGTMEDVKKFCQLAAPSILFPYIRETVHRLTMDAPNGVVRLDPMNISHMLNQTEWAMLETAEVATSPSIEPPPPSSQSPSASPDSEP